MLASTHLTSAALTAEEVLGGRYSLERQIGRGASATVFLARDVRCDRRVAIKILNDTPAGDSAAERFQHEIATIANLQHPNIVPLFDCGESDGSSFYVMPYVAGETLRARLDREGALPIAEAVRIATSVAGALNYAHRHGVVHRDVKPENILLHDGEVMIADFGIAFTPQLPSPRLTQTGASIGTPLYMSPEQLVGDDTVDARSDVYSLAVLLFEMVCGQTPHTGQTTQTVIARVLTQTPRRASELRRGVPRQLDVALARGLEKAPADRFPTAADFAGAIAATALHM